MNYNELVHQAITYFLAHGRNQESMDALYCVLPAGIAAFVINDALYFMHVNKMGIRI